MNEKKPWSPLDKLESSSQQDDYNGPMGGPKTGPTSFIQGIACTTSSVTDIFFAVLPLDTFHHIRDRHTSTAMLTPVLRMTNPIGLVMVGRRRKSLWIVNSMLLVPVITCVKNSTIIGTMKSPQNYC